MVQRRGRQPEGAGRARTEVMIWQHHALQPAPLPARHRGYGTLLRANAGVCMVAQLPARVSCFFLLLVVPGFHPESYGAV